MKLLLVLSCLFVGFQAQSSSGCESAFIRMPIDEAVKDLSTILNKLNHYAESVSQAGSKIEDIKNQSHFKLKPIIYTGTHSFMEHMDIIESALEIRKNLIQGTSEYLSEVSKGNDVHIADNSATQYMVNKLDVRPENNSVNGHAIFELKQETERVMENLPRTLYSLIEDSVHDFYVSIKKANHSHINPEKELKHKYNFTNDLQKMKIKGIRDPERILNLFINNYLSRLISQDKNTTQLFRNYVKNLEQEIKESGGNSDKEFQLGLSLHFGYPVDHNVIEILSKVADLHQQMEEGNSIHVDVSVFKSFFVSRNSDKEKAVLWLEKAKKEGHLEAEIALIVLRYFQGNQLKDTVQEI